jgi:hypothetical protein
MQCKLAENRLSRIAKINANKRLPIRESFRNVTHFVEAFRTSNSLYTVFWAGITLRLPRCRQAL